MKLTSLACNTELFMLPFLNLQKNNDLFQNCQTYSCGIRGILKNIKFQTKLFHLRHEIFSNSIHLVSKLVIYTCTFRYSLISRAFPKAKYSVYAQNLQWVQNSIFPNSFSLIKIQGNLIFHSLY